MIELQCVSNTNDLWNVLFGLMIGGLITHLFNRRSDTLRLKFDKSNEVYLILQKILHLLFAWHALPFKGGRFTLKELSNESERKELSNESERIGSEIDALFIQADFILNSCLKPYPDFYTAKEKINQYIHQNQENVKLKQSSLSESDIQNLFKKTDEIKKEADMALIKVMGDIKLDTKNIFFINRILRFFKIFKKIKFPV